MVVAYVGLRNDIISPLKSQNRSTLEIAMNHFVHLIAIVAIVVGLLTGIAEAANGKSARQVLESSSAALFGQVPEGLLPTATISLLIASFQMEERNVLVRKLEAVETLGCVDVQILSFFFCT
jgi:magnesium-transporting ATPase (P-type)